MTTIKTNYKTAKRAAQDIAEKIAKDIDEILGDKPVVTVQDGSVVLHMDFAFDSAIGFTNGEGLYGNEGFGPCGPVFDEENSTVILEPLSSVSCTVIVK